MHEEKEWLQAEPQHLDERLDKVLTEIFPEYSRSYFQKLIDKGNVTINGKIPKKRDTLKLADEISVEFEVSEEITLTPENIPLNILFEDEHLIAINKPAGMVVHPAPGHPNGTLVNALLYHCNLEKPEGSVRPGIVHRLDKDTSGVIIAAKTLQAHMKLSKLFMERKIVKTYVAICLGNPGNVTIDAALARHPVNRKEIAVSDKENAKKAITVCKTMSHNKELSFVELNLITGRTHQIRVHLKHKNCPILGDEVYGSSSANKKYGAKRQLLHAYSLSFEHPFTKNLLTIVGPIPEDIQSYFKVFTTLEKKYLLD